MNTLFLADCLAFKIISMMTINNATPRTTTTIKNKPPSFDKPKEFEAFSLKDSHSGLLCSYFHHLLYISGSSPKVFIFKTAFEIVFVQGEPWGAAIP